MNRYRVKTKALAGLSINDTVKCRNGLCECIGSGYTFEEGVIDRNPKWFEEVGDEFEVGDWVVVEESLTDRYPDSAIGRVSEYKGDADQVRVIVFNKTEDNRSNLQNTDTIRKATKEEVEKHLIKEAERRGFVKNKTFKSINVDTFINKFNKEYSSNKGHKRRVGSDIYYDDETDTLVVSGYGAHPIYYQGTWAEIIDQTPDITINNHEVELKENKVEIGCTEIKDEVFDALHQLNRAYDLKYHRKGDNITKQIIQIAKHFGDQPCPDK